MKARIITYRCTFVAVETTTTSEWIDRGAVA